ncbi:MAG: aminoacyl-tRNA hydrolase [Lentisphaeria bacterium]|jgi:PTH1 family peptidyl-tRNA hydrolase|nr:aminoacyl-tRNA hydrolase [Lentisphaeria bacterium]NLZ60287.1 aminoacyl-tRNA hydrolase [Lentisphaerota bacterium]
MDNPPAFVNDTDLVDLLVCLGNPGAEYAQSRHNAAWKVADKLREIMPWSKTSWQPQSAELWESHSEAKAQYLLLPMTYMNDSGKAVQEMLDALGISPRRITVVCDCMDLPLGALRLRSKGSSAGQKGLQSIIQVLRRDDLPRLRIGIGRPEPGAASKVEYVLAPWASTEIETMDETFSRAAEALQCLLQKGWQAALERISMHSVDNINAEAKGEA